MSGPTFSGRQLKKAAANGPAGKHHKPPVVIRMWHVASGILALAAVITLSATGIIIRATAAGPAAAPKLAFQSGASAATDSYVDQQTQAEDQAIAANDQLWISHIRELSQAQRAEMAQRQALAEQAARQAAEAEAKKQQAAAQAAASTSTMSTASASVLLVGDQSQARAIDIYLTEQGSPMVGFGRAFVSAGKTFGVDPFLVVAIAGKESSWGKHCFHPYNAWGWGEVTFNDWENAIFNYTRLLGEEYISKGRTDINVIAPIYCPPNYVSWANDVTKFYGELAAIQVGLNR
jgi:hypothetical protein